MRYRKLTDSGDFSFGSEQGDFWIDRPEAVAQAVETRLRLEKGQWYLDTSDGTDWQGKVLGNRTAATRDTEIRLRVLRTPNAVEIERYNSNINSDTRKWSAAFSLKTAFGEFIPITFNYITPSLIPQPQPPAEPVNVMAVVTSDTSVFVSWMVYEVPGQDLALGLLGGAGGAAVTTAVMRRSRAESIEFSYEFG